MSPDEWLYRIIPNDINFYKQTLDHPVLRTAFDPNKADVDGLSLYREDFVHFKTLANSYFGLKNKHCYIARLLTKDVLEIGTTFGFTVAPAPDGPPSPAGHVVIPQFTFASVKARKPLAKEIQVNLAKLASKSIVLKPPTK